MPLQVDILCDRMVGPAQPPGRRKGVTCFVRVRALAGGRLSPCASPDVADKERHWGFLSPTPSTTSIPRGTSHTTVRPIHAGTHAS